MDRKAYGAAGETRAAEFLARQGYKILDVNWAARCGELDVVAADGDTVVFVEVKYRSTLKYGYPSEAVTARKQFKISQVAAAYIQAKKLYGTPARFDVVEVLDGKFIRHIKDAFYSKISF